MSEPTKIEREHYAKLVGRQITAIVWEELEDQALAVLLLTGWDREGNAYQLVQSLYAFGSGGFQGIGSGAFRLGRPFSDDTLRRELQRLRFTWKRSRYTLDPDPEAGGKKEAHPAATPAFAGT